MNDIKEIEMFLNKIKQAAQNGMTISPRMVYKNLIYLGRRKVSKSLIDDNFKDWINKFKSIENIKVFVSARYPYFCQFVNDDYNVITTYNMIKMYIPVDDAHINEAAKRIFNFMAENQMIHHSKIGSEVRFDDIVIRINSIENAKKIEEFVMNDPYIREGLMKPNPFAFNNGYISYAWDGELSFNTVISAYISGYINELKNNNKLDTASYKGLVTYIAKVYEAVFKEGKYKSDYMAIMEVEEEYQLDNYQKVTELLLHSIMPDKKLEDFFKYYKDNIIQETKEDDAKIYISKRQKEDWTKIYDYLLNKYGYDEANQRIFMFIEKEDYNIFTRENGIRNYLINNNFTKDMVKELFLLTTKEKRNILYDASYDTYQKYGYNQIFVALKNAFSGNYKNFTNDNKGREMMRSLIMPGEVRGLIIGELLENGYNIEEIIYQNENLLREYINQLETRKKSKNHT